MVRPVLHHGWGPRPSGALGSRGVREIRGGAGPRPPRVRAHRSACHPPRSRGAPGDQRRGGSAVGAVVGPPATPILTAQTVITSGVYAATAFGLDAGARIAGTVSESGACAPATTPGPACTTVARRPGVRGRLGPWGDTYQWRLPTLAPDLHVRRAGAPSGADRGGVRAARQGDAAGRRLLPRPRRDRSLASRCRHAAVVCRSPPPRRQVHPRACPLQHRVAHLRQRPGARRSAPVNSSRPGPSPSERIVLIGHSMGDWSRSCACVADLPGAPG